MPIFHKYIVFTGAAWDEGSPSRDFSFHWILSTTKHLFCQIMICIQIHIMKLN